MSPSDLEAEDAVVVIEARGQGFYQVYYGQEKDPSKRGRSSHPNAGGILGRFFKVDLGSVFVVKPDHPTYTRKGYGNCDGAWMVRSTSAKDKWGPLLYDVAIEWATLNYNGLMSDKEIVSPPARVVWDYYLANRSDITIHQLDNLKNELTPDNYTDNCLQKVITNPGKRNRPNPNWQSHALSKRYTKEPTTIEQLKSINRLVILK
jgi:hypothetical protein